MANVTGALELLTFPDQWQQYGLLTVNECAALMQPMFDQFCFNQGACRVIGEIIAYAGSTSPDARWLLCDGSSLLRSDYPDLFVVVGTNYGAVDGSHFSLPDMRGRAGIGVGTGPGLTSRALGDSFGEETHVIIVSELATHNHIDAGHSHSIDQLVATAAGLEPTFASLDTGVQVASTGSGTANISSTGSNTGHNTMQPSLAISYLIVALS